MEVIMREIEAGLNEKLTPEEEEKILDELMAYGAKQAKKLGIKDRDVVRIIREFRANNRAS